MGRSGATRKKKKARSRLPTRRRWRALLTPRVGVAAGGVVAGAGLFVGLVALDRSLAGYARRHALDEGPRVTLVEPAAWLGRPRKDELKQEITRAIGEPPLDADALERAADALGGVPCVKRVKQLRFRPGGIVEAEAVYRQPVALVEGPEGYRLVSRSGVCLSGLYMSHHVEALELPLIVGVSEPPRGAGKPWAGKDLRGGIRLVEQLADEPYADQIRAYDVSGRDERGRVRVELEAENGGAVRWGFPPGTGRALEPSPAKKENRLMSVYRRKGSIDAGGQVVDLTGPTVMTYPGAGGDRSAAEAGP